MNNKKLQPAFSDTEYKRAKLLLATQVTQMMGRKLEEDDWNQVYCGAKEIPGSNWSNLYIDVNYNGLGIEHKLLRISNPLHGSIKSVCGTTLMHPSATRSIRIRDVNKNPNDVMVEVFSQYSELIKLRTENVKKNSGTHKVDMRTGWLLWESSLSEFLYFEETLWIPQVKEFYAEWNITQPKGARKGSKSLWIFERETDKKRFSVTTSAGIKIQPYFDVPPPSDSNLYYFRVQSEPINDDTVQIWISTITAKSIEQHLGSLTKEVVSNAIISIATDVKHEEYHIEYQDKDLAKPIQMTSKAFDIFKKVWKGKSDEHSAQLFLRYLQATR